MKCDVNPKFWDVKAGKAGGWTIEATKINALIENTQAAIFKIYRDLQERDNYATAERCATFFSVQQSNNRRFCNCATSTTMSVNP
jgi:hypothetical protein